MVRADQITVHLDRSMGFNGNHLGVLRETADVIVKLISVIFERLCRMGEVAEDWKKANLTLS